MAESGHWSTVRLHQLRDLLAVVETGSLRAAARRLGLTQPSLTKSLRQLEEQIGIPLLIRSRYGVTLTSAGQRLVSHARAIEAEMRRTAEDLDLLRGGMDSSVSIGVSLAAAPDFIARALECLRRQEPRVRLQVFEGVHEQLVADVRQGVVDFAIMPVGERAHLADLRIRPVFEARVVVVGRAGHPSRGARSLADLAAYDWVTPRRGGTLDGLIERLTTDLGLAPFSRLVQCDSAAIYWELISCGDLVGLTLTGTLQARSVQAMNLRILYDGPPMPSVPVALVHRMDFPQNTLAGRLAELCREQGAAYVGRG